MVDIQTLGSENRTQVENYCRQQAKVVPLNDGSASTAVVRVLGKYNLAIDTIDLSVGMPLALDGYWEMWITRFLITYVKPGWNAIDVGACWGYYTLLLADLVGPDGRVEAWEPNKESCAAITRYTLPLNGELADRVIVRHAAAWHEVDQLTLGVDDENLGGSKIQERLRPTEPTKRYQSVTAAQLDSTGLSRVDFIKIDAEGSEERIWLGMRELLRRGEPLAIMMEFTPRMYREPRGFLIDMVAQGFEVNEITSQSTLKPIDQDELAVRPGWVPLWLSRK